MTKELEKNLSDWEFSNKPFFSSSVNISGVLESFIRKIGRKFLQNIFEMIW